MDAAAVALKVAVVAAAGTVTEGGTVRSALLLASVTTDPPAAAAESRTTGQVELAVGLIGAGVQATDEPAGIVMTPLVPAETASGLPPGSTPTGLVTAIVAVPALAGRVSCTVAAIPGFMALTFSPVSRQVSDPDAPRHTTSL